MKLNNEQLNEVATWFAGGASVAEIQKRVAEEFGVSLTYLDARLLVAELPQPEESDEILAEDGMPAEQASAEQGQEIPAEQDISAEQASTGQGQRIPAEQEGYGELTLDVDAIMIPGTMASGNVTFSDGVSGKWYLDQSGRLGLGNIPEGYRPSQADSAMFQQKLMDALRAKGLA